MKRRHLLTGATSVGAMAVGVAGLYRGAKQNDSPVDEEDAPIDEIVTTSRNETDAGVEELEVEPETRSGSMLSAMTFREFSPTYFSGVEEWLGGRHAMANSFVNMEQSNAHRAELIGRFETTWQRGYVPHVFWQPNFGESYGEETLVAEKITAGTYDTEIEKWAADIETWAVRPGGDPDRRIYLNLGPEFNGDWVPWGVNTEGMTEELYADMWHHVREIVMNTRLESNHVQWVWTANHVSSEPTDIQSCYPGDEIVDWVGVTGYNWENWGGWTDPAQLFDGMIDRIRRFSDKPLSFAEFGASADCNDSTCPDRKGEWIEMVYDYFAARDVRIAGWFDQREPGGTEWGVFDTREGTGEFTIGGQTVNVYEEYRDAFLREDVLPAHPSAPRRLTDAEFSGSFPAT